MNAVALALLLTLPLGADVRVPAPGGGVNRTSDGSGGWWYVVDYRALTADQKKCFPSMWRAEFDGTLGRRTLLNPSGSTRVFLHEDSTGRIVPNWGDRDAYYDAIMHNEAIFGALP